jgi:hypothetical protein
MRPDATAPEAHGYSLSKGDNKVWPHFDRNPSGRAHLADFVVSRRSQMPDMSRCACAERSSLLEPGQSSSRRCRLNSVNRP